jgi:hypothetical protein
VKETLKELLVAITDVIVGALEEVFVGVADAVAADGEDSPTAFVAVTTNVYDVPFVRPSTVIGDVKPYAVILPGVDVAV